jgi:hypothetical protein
LARSSSHTSTWPACSRRAHRALGLRACNDERRKAQTTRRGRGDTDAGARRDAVRQRAGPRDASGIDQSPEFIAVAETLAAADGVGDRIRCAVGDAHALDLPAASFDAAVAHTLVSHVRDPG